MNRKQRREWAKTPNAMAYIARAFLSGRTKAELAREMGYETTGPITSMLKTFAWNYDPERKRIYALFDSMDGNEWGALAAEYKPDRPQPLQRALHAWSADCSPSEPR